jgi:hypothetical protein
MNTYSEIVSIASIVISLSSALIAYSLYRLSMRQVSGDVIHRIIDRLEAPPMRELRRVIYNLDRDKFSDWDEEFQTKIDRWGAELDVISTLLSQEEDIKAFFMLYGDVFLRSIYQMAPYGNFQRTRRGEQFLLPLERFGNKILKVWKKSIKKKEYSRVIGVPGPSNVSLSVETFLSDRHCQNFLDKRG